jgi:hypothetical protein
MLVETDGDVGNDLTPISGPFKMKVSIRSAAIGNRGCSAAEDVISELPLDVRLLAGSSP